MPKVLQWVVKNGGNTLRDVSEFEDGDANWQSYKLGEPEYFPHLHAWLDLVGKYKLTQIVCLSPYIGSGPPRVFSDDEYRLLIREIMKHRPYVKLEMVNEPTNNILQRRVVNLCLSEGVQPEEIQVQYIHSDGDFNDMVQTQLSTVDPDGTIHVRCFICYHYYGTLAHLASDVDINNPDSDAMKWFLTGHLYLSDDGSNDGSNGEFFGLHPGASQNPKKPTPQELYDLTFWTLKKGGKGHELLWNGGFKNSDIPSTSGIISSDGAYLQAMRRAYNDFIGGK